eukprot:3476619-Rhodomonas_salina.3
MSSTTSTITTSSTSTTTNLRHHHTIKSKSTRGSDLDLRELRGSEHDQLVPKLLAQHLHRRAKLGQQQRSLRGRIHGAHRILRMPLQRKQTFAVLPEPPPQLGALLLGLVLHRAHAAHLQPAVEVHLEARDRVQEVQLVAFDREDALLCQHVAEPVWRVVRWRGRDARRVAPEGREGGDTRVQPAAHLLRRLLEARVVGEVLAMQRVLRSALRVLQAVVVEGHPTLEVVSRERVAAAQV